MNNIIMRKIEVTSEYEPLSEDKLVASVTISALPTNRDPVYFRNDQGEDIPWQAGEWHNFWSVNLNEIFVKGTAGDIVTIIGGTW